MNPPQAQLRFDTDNSRPQSGLHPHTEVMFQWDSEDKQEQ